MFFNFTFYLFLGIRGNYNESTVSGLLNLWNLVTMNKPTEFVSLLHLKELLMPS